MTDAYIAGIQQAGRYHVRCSCGWTPGDFADRGAAVKWRRWHLFQVTPKGSRPSDSGHVVTITDRRKWQV